MGLSGKVALVVGAGSGIGAATAVALGARGVMVCCADLFGEAAAATAARITEAGGTAVGVALDARDETAWEQVLRDLEREHPRLDLLVNAVGIAAASPLGETTLDEWRRVMAANLDAAFLATKQGLRAMNGAGGAIVHVGSASGRRPPPGAVAYSVSKAALGALVRAAARECRESGSKVRVNAVSPAGVRTPLWRQAPFFQDLVVRLGSEEAAFDELSQGPGGPFLVPEDVAGAILFLLSDEARHVTGVELAVDDGYVL